MAALIALYNQTDVTSIGTSPLYSQVQDDYPVSIRLFIWGDIGTGSVALEFKMGDATWVSFPDLTFTSTTAQDIALFEGAEVRVVIAGATSANVEVLR